MCWMYPKQTKTIVRALSNVREKPRCPRNTAIKRPFCSGASDGAARNVRYDLHAGSMVKNAIPDKSGSEANKSTEIAGSMESATASKRIALANAPDTLGVALFAPW